MQRIITKEGRMAARWIPSGMTIYREIPGAIVYASPDKLHAVAYRGTAMNPEFNYKFRSSAQLDQECEQLFDRVKAHNEYRERKKAEIKTGVTDTQKVKKALKDAGYPVTSVTRGSGTAHNWIEIKIDDYQSKVNDKGRMESQYGDVMVIAKEASGRSHREDDIQTDYFCVNISVTFTKHHLCSECVISNCEKYHTPDSGACGGFYNAEMSVKQDADFKAYLEDERVKKEAKEAYERSPEYLKLKQEEDDLKRAEAYAKECEKTREELGHPYVYHGDGTRSNTQATNPCQVQKKPHEVKEITITRAEGPCALCDKPKYFDSFQSAKSYLIGRSSSFPSTGGYDKHDFKIVFVDGEEYSGRLDCKAYSCPDNDLDVFEHVRSFQVWHAKNNEDPEIVKKCQDFINRYLLPVDPSSLQDVPA
jgi:hypothetical protein